MIEKIIKFAIISLWIASVFGAYIPGVTLQSAWAVGAVFGLFFVYCITEVAAVFVTKVLFKIPKIKELIENHCGSLEEPTE